MAYSSATKTSGIGYLVKINTSGNNASPSWTTISAQKGLKFAWKNKAINVTGKDDAGWDAYIPGQAEWSITFDGSVILADTGLIALETAMKNSTTIYIEVTRPDSNTYVGNAVLTSLEFDAAVDKEAVFNCTLQGDQALVTYSL